AIHVETCPCGWTSRLPGAIFRAVSRSGMRAMSIGTRILTWLKGELVGTDRLGNKYYQEKGKPYRGRRRRRWVVYNGEAEPSRVPPEWHGWLHYTVDSPPKPDQPRRPW